MAKIRLHAPFVALHGKMGDLVFRTTRNGTTSVIRKADMSNVEWSPAQIAQRQRFREARLFARQAMADPEQRKAYEKVARRKHKRAYGVAMSDYFKKLKEKEQVGEDQA